MSISFEQRQLLLVIEIKRKQLLKIGEVKGIASAEVLAVSQKLDVLIYQYQVLALKELGIHMVRRVEVS